MRSASLLLLRAGLAGLVAVARGQSAASSGDDVGQCSCSGLDYTDGGSYLVDGSSTNDFTFTSEFEGCGQSTITPILVSPNGYGYECSPIESQLDGVEQSSSCAISYADMSSGTWTILIEAPEQNFSVQRQFNITVSDAGVNTVVVTVTPTVVESITSTDPGETITSWVVETETQYLDPETVTGNCYLQTDTVVQYEPGPITKVVVLPLAEANARPVAADVVTAADADVNQVMANNLASNHPNHLASNTTDHHHQPAGGHHTRHDAPKGRPTDPLHDTAAAHHDHHPAAAHDNPPVAPAAYHARYNSHADHNSDWQTPDRQSAAHYKADNDHHDTPAQPSDAADYHPGQRLLDGAAEEEEEVEVVEEEGQALTGPLMRQCPQLRQLQKLKLGRSLDITSTVYAATTVTSTVVEVQEGDPTTEYDFYTTLTTFTPPAETVCGAETTVTLLYQGPPTTEYQIVTVTHYTWATVWVRQTQYSTATDYDAMTRCVQAGGQYGV
ncbi:1e799c4a-77a1-463b-ba40-6354720574f3 [Thermothielavioides terrestris]|uniref:1e799c4a-77a1-463b-ba40-6354720574f3 n=1 Tax=Thermothielavioides terrestris TaxID=2587410 RepID=A0A446BLN7_9PEZI|nr:1e799c4a-77a1-463b-ba40-6354720574f3 [Thermothielavioides terrestris]